MAVIIDDDDEREDKDDKEESMDHPTTGNPRNCRQLEELVHHLEETKIEMQKKGENFVPMRSSNNNSNEIGLDALAPSLAKPVSASREMFERAKETLVLSGKTKITTVCFSNKSGALGVRAEGKIKANERIFEHSWREQRAPFGGMCMVAIEKLKFEYNVKEVYLELLKERFYSDGRKQAVPTSAQTFLKLAPEQFVRGGEEDLANAKYDCISDTYYALRDIQPGEEILIAKKDALAAKPGSVAITCDSESVENELLSWLIEEECAPLRLQPSQIHDVGVFLAADYSKPIEIPVSQLSELLQGHFRMAQCPHGWLTKEAPKKSKNGSGDLDEAMRNRIRERFGFTTANQTFPLQGGFHRVTFAQFLNHDGDDANVARDRKKPVATYKFTNNRKVGIKGDEITIDYRVDSPTEDARDLPANKVFYKWAIEKKGGPWDEIGKGAKERKGAVDYSKWDNIDTDSD
ncbi:unnamed protein product [Bathycoccus prasinos]|jgi:hypothetical protein